MLRQGQQRVFQLRIAAETFRPVHQPQVQLVFQAAQVAVQLGVVALRIVHQVARMHLEKCSQNLPRGIGQMGPRAALNLRQVTLAQLLAGLGLDRPHRLLLAQVAVKPAQAALHLAQVPDFFAQLHKDSSQRTVAGQQWLSCPFPVLVAR